jgi:hypothetical protein
MNSPMIVTRGGKIIAVDANDMPATIVYKRD